MNVRPNSARWTRGFSAAVGLVSTAIMAGQLALVAPASAAVPGLLRVVTSGPSNSDWKTTNANCPSGTQVIGGGGFVNGAGGQVVLDTMLPLVGGGGYSVTGREDDTGYSGNWSIVTTALCARPPAGLETVSALSDSNSTSLKSMPVSCTPGKRVLGLGGDMSGGLGQVVIEGLIPNADLAGVTVVGREDGNGYAGNWLVHAKAICATPPSGLQLITAFGLLDSNNSKWVEAVCPAGKRVHGVGAEIIGGQGQVRLTGAWAVSDTEVRVAGAEDEDGFIGNWAVKAYAICA